MSSLDKKELRIRPVVAGDISSTLNIWWASIPEKGMLASQLGSRLDLSLMAEYQGHLAGFVLARLIYSGVPMTGVGVIYFIAVKPDYQRSGIGSILVETLKNNCKAQGIGTIRALIPGDDVNTMRYFEKLGFSPSATMNFDITV